jgi:hypothetical protein
MEEHLLQQYALGDLRGELEQTELAMRELVAGYPARVVFRWAVAHLHARLGRLPEPRRALGVFVVDDFSALPFDQERLSA